MDFLSIGKTHVPLNGSFFYPIYVLSVGEVFSFVRESFSLWKEKLSLLELS
jgi:hypothetical protein